MSYRGEGEPAASAPLRIRNGGTIVTITDLHDDVAIPRIETLADRLSAIYRPGIKAGKVIELRLDSEKMRLTAYGRRARHLTGEKAVAHGRVRDMPFRIEMGKLDQHFKPLYGLHIAYGHRIIRTETVIEGVTLPAIFTADLILGDAWKVCLSVDKTEIIRYKDELLRAANRLMAGWIEEMRRQADEIRLHELKGKITLNVMHAIDKAATGNWAQTYGHGKRNRREGRQPPQPRPKPGPLPNDKPRAQPRKGAVGSSNGTYAASEIKPRRRGLRVDWAENLGNTAAIVELDALRGPVVRLNLNNSEIKEALNAVPVNMDVLWPIIAHALSTFAASDPETFDREIMSGFMKQIGELSANLGEQGFEQECADALFWFLLSEKQNIVEGRRRRRTVIPQTQAA